MTVQDEQLARLQKMAAEFIVACGEYRVAKTGADRISFSEALETAQGIVGDVAISGMVNAFMNGSFST